MAAHWITHSHGLPRCADMYRRNGQLHMEGGGGVCYVVAWGEEQH